MPTPSSNPFDRASYALAGVAGGELDTAIRAIVSPKSLAPSEQQTLAERWGLIDRNDDSAMAGVLRALSSPLILAGAVLALKYPIPLAKDMFRFSQNLSGLNRKVGFVLRKVGNIDQLFAGTDIPELYKKLLRDVNGFKDVHRNKLGEAILKAEKAGLPFDRRTEVLLAARLDNLDHLFKSKPTLGPAFETLVNDSRAVLDDIYDQVFGKTEAFFQLRKTAEKTFGHAKAAATRGTMAQLESQHIINAMGLKKRQNYWPWQLSVNSKSYENQAREAIKRSMGFDIDDAGDLKVIPQSLERSRNLRATETMTTRHALARGGTMVPDPGDLEVVADMLKPGELDRLKAATQGINVAGGRVSRMPRSEMYSLRFRSTMSSYVHSMARAFGFTVNDAELIVPKKGNPFLNGTGRKLVTATNEIAEVDPVRARMMADTYIPLALGRLSMKQAASAARWTDFKMGLAAKLESSDQLSKLLPKDIKTWLTESLKNDRGIFSYHNLSRSAAGHLYLGTLGANPVSASYNMLQLMLTTVPVIGPKWTAVGLKQTVKRAPEYFRARLNGMAHATALGKAYPEFAASGLAGDPISEDAIGSALASAWDMSLTSGPASRQIDRVKRAMMSMFSVSEHAVRLASFEGGLAKAKAEGLTLADSLFTARRVTEATQFLGGPANKAAFTLGMNPLMSQFLHFPARTVGFLAGDATEIGSGAKSGLFGRNYGTLGRMMLSSGITYEIGKTLFDMDLSHGLMFGALPVPNPRSPFSPFPFVPPAVGLAGAAAQDVLKGEIEQLRYSLPILVPGGLEISRLSNKISPELAKTLGRDYVDYDAMNGEGRYPVYTAKGALRGYFTPMQIWSKTLGLGGGPEADRVEKELEAYLLSQRDQIRGYRHEFVELIMSNEVQKAQAVRDEYDRRYPGLGGISVTSQDMRAAYMRRLVPRLERLLDTMPKETRPLFGQLIAQAFQQEAAGLLGVDPIMLQGSMTARQRDTGRVQPPQSIEDSLARLEAYRKTGSYAHTAFRANGLVPRPIEQGVTPELFRNDRSLIPGSYSFPEAAEGILP